MRAIPDRWNTVQELDALFDVYPGGIRNIWVNRNYDDITDLVDRREKVARKLEDGETELIMKCQDAAQKAEKKSKKKSRAADQDPMNLSGPVWERYLKKGDRPTHRRPIFEWNFMPSLPNWLFIGKKVDTIIFCRMELARLNKEIEEAQAEPDKYPLMNSAFVQFNNQAAAHMACQAVTHHVPRHMAPRIVEISPNDVIWDNMSIPWWQQYLRTAGIAILVFAMIALWAIPVAFAGTLSQIDTVKKSLPWLAGWLGNAPGWVISIVQGILPIAIIAILVALLPVILRLLVRLEGKPTGTSI